MEHLLTKLGRQKWNVHIRERYPYGQGVLIYLARYRRGGPMAQPRLRSCDGGQGAAGPVECCPVCGQQLVCVAVVPRARAPPPAEAVWEQVA